jgi:hypothetical protein
LTVTILKTLLKMKGLNEVGTQQEVSPCLDVRTMALMRQTLFPSGRNYRQPGVNKSFACWRNWH